MGWSDAVISSRDDEYRALQSARTSALLKLTQYIITSVKSSIESEFKLKRLGNKIIENTRSTGSASRMTSEIKNLRGLTWQDTIKIDNDGKTRIYSRFILDTPALIKHLRGVVTRVDSESKYLIGQENPNLSEMKDLLSEIKESRNQTDDLGILLTKDQDIEKDLLTIYQSLDARIKNKTEKFLFKFDDSGLSQEDLQITALIKNIVVQLGWQMTSSNAPYTIKLENFNTEDIVYKITQNIPGIMIRGDVILRVYGIDNKEFILKASGVGRGETRNLAWRKFLESLESPLRNEFQKQVGN